MFLPRLLAQVLRTKDDYIQMPGGCEACAASDMETNRALEKGEIRETQVPRRSGKLINLNKSFFQMT